MNQIDSASKPGPERTFTQKQGQYLAFIWAYTRVLGRPPAEADLQRYFRSPRPRFTKWFSPSNARVLYDVSRAARAASKYWSPPRACLF